MENRLTPIRKIGTNKWGSPQWEYLCSCGNTCIKLKGNVGRNTFSCGCLRKETQEILAKQSKNRTPTNALKDPKENSFNSLYCSYVSSARRKKRKFELNKEQFKIIVSSNCFYCNTPPSNIKIGTWAREPFIYNGIDRKNNNGGYTVENCVPCCKQCNYMKSDKNIQDFLKIIQTIYSNVKF